MKRLVLGFCLTVAGVAQTAFAPKLLPGEGLAVSAPEGTAQVYGEAKRESPMGSLAKLVWLRVAGEEWAAMGVSYKCTGQAGPYHCWLAKGHGKVDLSKATQESCNLAYLSWAQEAAQRWKRQLGEGAGRVLLEDAFRSFLGNRLPAGDLLPEITPPWVGDGDLLRTSPEAMLQWLQDPVQESMLSQVRRLLLGSFMNEFKGGGGWWMKTGTAPVPGDPAATSAWVVGSDGGTIAVLHLPQGRGKAEGLARFRAVMGLPDKP
ncbi:MAG TPA: hypothetical protein VN436_15800 [Holophaga sp.]|nr:hypothetical protein [Holophaga sp.]